MANPGNLKPFAKGRSGNPGGRPAGRSVTARLRELLEAGEIDGRAIKGGKQVADLVAEVLLKGALQGDPKLIAMLLDRTEGKASNSVDPEEQRAAPHEIPDADPRFLDRDEHPALEGVQGGPTAEGAAAGRAGGDGEDVGGR